MPRDGRRENVTASSQPQPLESNGSDRCLPFGGGAVKDGGRSSLRPIAFPAYLTDSRPPNRASSAPTLPTLSHISSATYYMAGILLPKKFAQGADFPLAIRYGFSRRPEAGGGFGLGSLTTEFYRGKGALAGVPFPLAAR